MVQHIKQIKTCKEHGLSDISFESTEAMQIKHRAQGQNILLPGFEPSTSVSRNRHSSQTTKMLRSGDESV